MVSELIAHEFGHVDGILKALAAMNSLPQFWWPKLNPKTNANACQAGRSYREEQGWDPYGHDELTKDCIGCLYTPGPVAR